MIEVGEVAPAFRLPDTDGRPLALDELAGGPVLLVFLPAAFTPVCSGELGDLVRIQEPVAAAGGRALAVACDSMFALRTWAEREGVRGGGLLLSDFWPHGEVSRAYGAFDADRGTGTRASYLIDGDGVVRWSTRTAAGVARDLDEHLAAVEELGAGR